jgi:hypothetical protein
MPPHRPVRAAVSIRRRAGLTAGMGKPLRILYFVTALR